MGFRNPPSSSAVLDTAGTNGGVRAYNIDGNPATGVVEWYAASAMMRGQLVGTQTGSGGTGFTFAPPGGAGPDSSGAANAGFDLNREQQAAGGYLNVVRLRGDKVVGPTVAAEVYANTTQSIATGVWTPLVLAAASVNIGGVLYGSDPRNGAPPRLTVPVNGVYSFHGVCQFGAAAAGSRRGVRWNTARNATAAAAIPPGGVGGFIPSSGNVTGVTARELVVQLDAGGWVELQALHEAGANLSTFVNADSTTVVTCTLVQAL